MLNLAIHAFDHGAAPARAPALHAARAHIANAGRMVGQSAVHLHGAMGKQDDVDFQAFKVAVENLADNSLARLRGLA